MQRAEQVVVGQAVVDELPALVALHQPGVLEDAQVLGQRRLGHLEALGDLAGRERGLGEVGQDLSSRRRGEGGEDVVDVHVLSRLAIWLIVT